MMIGYIRLARLAPSQAQQDETLHGAGLPNDAPLFVDQPAKSGRNPDYADVTPRRLEMIHGLAEGDIVMVASASQLGTSADDIHDALRAIHERGASVRDASTNETIRWHPDAEAAIAFVLRGLNGLTRAKAAHMRANRPDDRKGGAPTTPADKLKQAEALWFNFDFKLPEIEERTGISHRTLYRHFGPRKGQRKRPRSETDESKDVTDPTNAEGPSS